MIPLATTTITILRPDSEDPEDGQQFKPVAAGIRAVIGSPSGGDRSRGGDQQIITNALEADPCDLRHYDRVRDDTTRRTHAVVWCEPRTGLGLDHVAAGLRFVDGESNG